MLVCIILTTFVYLHCKLALQLQSKHIKILKKQKSVNKAQINWHASRKTRKEKEKVLLTKRKKKQKQTVEKKKF